MAVMAGGEDGRSYQALKAATKNTLVNMRSARFAKVFLILTRTRYPRYCFTTRSTWSAWRPVARRV